MVIRDHGLAHGAPLDGIHDFAIFPCKMERKEEGDRQGNAVVRQ
jgi:hypothetical protein